VAFDDIKIQLLRNRVILRVLPKKLQILNQTTFYEFTLLRNLS